MNDKYMDLDDIMPIGMIGNKLRSQKINNIDIISSAYLNKQDKLIAQQQWGYDSALIKGSQPRSDIQFSNNEQIKENISVWSINHYLGLNRNKEMMGVAIETIKTYGTGAGTSAMSGGHSSLHKELQHRFSALWNKEETLLYPTGFTANLGAISGLMKGTLRDNLILLDEECHASIIDGCKLSGARFLRFNHNDIDDLKDKLEKYQHSFCNIMVIVESIYSMSGDSAPLVEIAKLKQKYKFIFYVDESHSFGFFGENGEGLCCELNILDDVDVLMSTLSKSCASIGGVISTSHKYCAMLKWSSSYLYQAAIPAHDVAVILKALDIIKSPILRDELREKTAYLRSQLRIAKFNIGSGNSSIIPVYISDDILLKQMENALIQNGIYTVAIQYPIVKANTSRFRFIVNVSHTYQDIDNLVDILILIRKRLSQINNKNAITI
ncbi:aminotransferase class I/II-fold pyridoxal phosphate-dependent enzyme [Photobacterium damselae]|uniref:aminotransferase class I/II-fold pyridoxal phosphate-dependent enzyme n=1 Tax=Photobacterium damselae TaxID=38293 RepID=UPI00406987C9